MNEIHSLLAATDFSSHAGTAVRRAFQLAGSLGASLHLLHVVDAGRLQELRALLPDGAEAQERLLAEAKRLMAEATNALDGPCEKRVEIGSHPAAILAASRGHDLLVLGAHGGHPVREALLGSTADRLLLKAERPTLVVKRAADGPYRRVVIPCEYAPPARRALELALRVAPGARITLLHAFEVEFEGLLWRAAVPSERIAALKAEAAQRAHAWLDKLTDGLEGAEAVGTLADHGSAARVALEVADRVGADLVVMGKQGRAAVGELFLGSVTRRVLAEAKCDVLVAPASREP
jgi:nucleotide-binding universal stress UspA family protein